MSNFSTRVRKGKQDCQCHIWSCLIELYHVTISSRFRLLLPSPSKMAATSQLESLVSRLEQVTTRLENVSLKSKGTGGQSAVIGIV